MQHISMSLFCINSCSILQKNNNNTTAIYVSMSFLWVQESWSWLRLIKKLQCECWLQEAGVGGCVCMRAWRISYARCQLPVAIFVTQQNDAGNKNISWFLSFSFFFAAMLHWPYVALGVGFDFEGSYWPRFQTQHTILPLNSAAIQLSVWDTPNP